ncbi:MULTISPECIES: sensor histidine kinase [Mycolicibacterium]|uniref:histidine kinase n=1 Tax=Mycolicibacterium chlorophenolicum TaxID=37916 RepID=A0A0J6Z388_9MYCO|nr:ATP-binding protein [Mycolicibacterium chlorophenolicum]KMO79121.1 Nitrate/nitrite sensor protein NarX [Mycolicibacterium chlorophenolicum]
MQQVAPDSQLTLLRGTLLQLALRALLTAFIVVTLLLEPPVRDRWICVAVLMVYVVVIGCWSVWVRTPARAALPARTAVTLLVSAADVLVVSALSVLSGVTSPQEWTSDVVRMGFFLIPLIAAAQLDPVISAAVAVPTVSAFLATCWITRSANEEPWASILLSCAVLAGLAGGSVALSFIQRSVVDTVVELARQRNQLLEELLGLEKRERQTISERLHDGALQYVLVARQDMEEVREGSTVAADRMESALVECSGLLRDVVRELHPDVLTRLGLKSAISALTESLTSRTKLAMEFDARTWPDDSRTEADYVLYSAAREALTNVIKHARAQHIWIELESDNGLASLRVADDGVGISEEMIARKAREGHIGMASIRTKVLASGGQFDVRSTSPGTELTISIPLPTAHRPAAGGLVVSGKPPEQVNQTVV